MILNYSVKNYKTFKNEVNMSFVADMRIKHFTANTIQIGNNRILKTTGLYGPNNTGKTCFLDSIYALKKLMLNERVTDCYNSFFDNYVTEYDVSYEANGNMYRYLLKYDSFHGEFLSEQLEKIIAKDYNNYSYEKLFVRDKEKIDIKLPKLKKMPLNLLNNNIPLFMMLSLKGTDMETAQNDYKQFANSIVKINLELPIAVNRTIELIKNDVNAQKFIISFAKNCDLNIEDFGYSDSYVSDVNVDRKVTRYFENVSSNKELLKIWSKHHNHTVPSVLFDSLGTRKIIALAGYIYDSIVNGGVLIIDELDSSLHHIIIRAIIALFNNELNKKSQLVFSTQDALTMDLRRLFRKDQIYLTDINDNGNNVLIHLSKEFTARDANGIRGNEDIVDYYLKGRFGGVPTPDLFDPLYEILSND